MNRSVALLPQLVLHILLWAVFVFGFVACSAAQPSSYERVFQQPKTVVQKAIREMQSSLSGRLPVLDGFATSDRALDHYQRGYYQSTLQVSSTASGGSLVRVSTKITAWYTDSLPARSGYQMLSSNGRLETDLLDQLADQLAKTLPGGENPPAPKQAPSSKPAIAKSVPAAPESKQAENAPSFSSPLAQGLPPEERAALQAAKKRPADVDPALQAEAESLTEILKNQSHPENLVAVRTGSTPVFSAPNPNAKPLFYASAHDEFEMLDFNVAWVHVRISGLSRGWIWRDSVEMPENFPGSDQPEATSPPAPFQVIRQETAPFPGDWGPLRGKTVKIISVQKTDENAKDSSPAIKLEFAKSLLDKGYTEVAKGSQDLAGIVLVFDAVDGGMIAATMAALKQWETGDLSDTDLWRQCFFDPPETFDASIPSASQ